MGGTLGNIIFEAGEKLAAKAAPSVSAGVSEGFSRMASKAFSLTSQLTGESGAALQGYLKKFEGVRDHHEAEAFKALDSYKANPIAFDAGVKSGALNKKYHTTISAGKGMVEPYIVKGSANMQARNEMFGPKDEIAQGFIDAIAREHGENKAKNIVDGLGVYFHDSVYQQGTGEASRLASNLKAKGSLVEDIPFRNSPYKAPGDIERGVQTATTSALAFKAGLAHTTTVLNGLIGRSLTSYAKGLSHMIGPGYADARAQIQAVGAIGQIFAEEHQAMYNFQNGIIKNYAPGSIGEFISKNWMVPGMGAVRSRTAITLAMQGKYAAQELFENLASQNIRTVERAQYDLKRLGLDHNKLLRQGGLHPEDIRAAMFNNTNDRMFLQSGLNRAPGATSTVIGRMIGQFHNYGAAQANFLQKELAACFPKNGPADPMSFVKTLAILGTVYPAVGGAVKGLEELWMGKGTDKAKEDLKSGVGLAEGSLMANQIDAFTHTAGFGIMTSYSRALSRHKLLESMAGPTINAGSELLQDAYKAEEGIRSGKDAKKGEYDVKSYAPFLRDILHDVPSLGAGAWAAEKYLPTQQTLNKQKPMTSKRLAAQRRRELKKARGE